MPEKIRTKENIPMISYKLRPTIRNKIVNYKQTIENIIIKNDNKVELPICKCNKSKYKDLNSGHIITGDLKIIKNNKLKNCSVRVLIIGNLIN